MAKTKSRSRGGSKDILRSTNAPLIKSLSKQNQNRSTNDLLEEAGTLLEQSQPDVALPLAREALRRLEADRGGYKDLDTLLRAAAQGQTTLPVALTLAAAISLALGDIDAARIQYVKATELDPDGALISAEPWLQLAQLCEEGGAKSMEYFDKATEVLRNEIEVLGDDESMAIEQSQEILDERRTGLANALCGMAEIYMTDLSWEADAEARCERLVTEAVAVCPERSSAGVLQTLASVRISQERGEEARRALTTSLSIWKDIPAEVEDPSRPDFATRVSLARLLMEVGAEMDGFQVCEGLVKEDDQSVESWYLGGWCQFLLGQSTDTLPEVKGQCGERAREWLLRCLQLCTRLQYEDDRLRDHAKELVTKLNHDLGIQEGEDDDEWEDAEEEEGDDADDEDLEIEPAHHDDVDGDVTMT